MGARLLEAYSDAKLDELGDFAPTETVQELVSKVDYSTPIENWPLLVQLTRFRYGGICLGAAISHTVVDGQAVNSFINSWAKLARDDDLGDDQMPFHDQTVLRSREPLIPPRFDHVEFTTKPPLLIGNKDCKADQQKETSVTLLKVTIKWPSWESKDESESKHHGGDTTLLKIWGYCRPHVEVCH